MLKKELQDYKEELEKLLTILEKSLEDVPLGTLRIAKSGKCLHYYHRMNTKDIKGTYIKKENKGLAEILAQKDYNTKLFKRVHNNLNRIEQLINSIDDIELTDIYDNLNDYRKALVKPYILNNAQYSYKWKNQPYSSKGFRESDPNFYTKNGVRVRSKSEVIIYDMMIEMNVVFKYECPIKLKNGEVRYPDFTILLPKTRKIYYWEHCGKMDDEKYLDDFFRKIELFSQNGIIVGQNLILTFESKNHMLDTRNIKRVIKSIIQSDC